MHKYPTKLTSIHKIFRIFGVIALLVGVQAVDARAQSIDENTLSRYIMAGMEQWQIPGMAVAIVRDDEVIFAKGFGVKKLGEWSSVDENTLFGIASTTKAMTATAMGMLVDEGLVRWDDPVIKHLPDFRLSDLWVTETVTISDILTHIVGVGRLTGNRIEFMPNRTRAAMMYHLRYHEFERPFRDGSVYSNAMYMVAGELIAAASGMSWDEFLISRLFRPLGMERTNTSITQFGDDENLAWPHQEINGTIQAIPRRNFDNVGASASVNSSVAELSRWMRMNLSDPGVLDGVRYVETTTMHDIHRPYRTQRIGNPYGAQSSYGYGWTISDYKGHRMLQHGGATDGMNTNLILMPNENIGIVILTNTFNRFMTALGYHILDELLDLERQDWSGNIWNGWERQYADAVARKNEVDAARVMDTSPSLPLEAYVGKYHDPLYDNAEVSLVDGALQIRFWDDETQILNLEHWHYDTFRASWINPAKGQKFVYFTLGDDGNVEHLNVTWTLRPLVLQVGIYPANYTRTTAFVRE